jgi:hypothetical protein
MHLLAPFLLLLSSAPTSILRSPYSQAFDHLDWGILEVNQLSCPCLLCHSENLKQLKHGQNPTRFVSAVISSRQSYLVAPLDSNSNPAPKHSTVLWFVFFHRHTSSGFFESFLLNQISTSRVSTSTLSAGRAFRFYSSDSTLPHSLSSLEWAPFPSPALPLSMVSFSTLIEFNFDLFDNQLFAVYINLCSSKQHAFVLNGIQLISILLDCAGCRSEATVRLVSIYGSSQLIKIFQKY